MDANSVVRARIDTATKEKRMLRIVDEQRLPFDVWVPNALTVTTMHKSAQGEDVHQARDAADLFEQLGI
jgi:DNA-damage-inducible protein J